MDSNSIVGLVRHLWHDWRTADAKIIAPLTAIRNERAFQNAENSGHKLHWTDKNSIRRRQREGWRPLVQRDALMRPHVFIDGREELLMMYKRSD